MKDCMREFTASLEKHIGNYRQPSFNVNNPTEIYNDVLGIPSHLKETTLQYGDEIIDSKVEEINQAYLDSLDEYIGAEVVVPGRNAEPVLAKVKKRKRDSSGNKVLDSRVYELEFPNGCVEEYSVNTIVENLVMQTDQHGWDVGLLDKIMDFRRDDSVAVLPEDGFVESYNGQKKPTITTKGWEALVRWKDSSSSWIPLALIKESNLVEMAEATIAFGVSKEPAFNWWVKHVLKHRERLINKLKLHVVRKGRLKFGIQIPGTVEEALRLDNENGNTFWKDAIDKEMKNSKVPFDLLPCGDKAPVGYKEITCHLVFDLKMDMTRKARYVAGGHLTDVPTSQTYSSVVSRDSVRIGFLIAALNNLDLLAGDIQNAFLSALTKERIYFHTGDEWKSDKGKVVIIVRALYGLKSSALQFRNFLANTVGNHLDFKPTLADPDIWYKPETAADGFKYYSYILVYVDDLLIIDKDPSYYMCMVQSDFTVKPGSIEIPKTYLGAEIHKVTYEDGSYAWTMSAEGYFKKVIANIKK